MKIYLAGPLFSEAERNWGLALKEKIQALARELGKDVNVIWPYELIVKEEIDALGTSAPKEIFNRCKDHLTDSDICVVNLDGTQVDDGTAWEAGYFYALKSADRQILGIRTDFRRAGEADGAIVNPMIECCCDQLVMSTAELLMRIESII